MLLSRAQRAYQVGERVAQRVRNVLGVVDAARPIDVKVIVQQVDQRAIWAELEQHPVLDGRLADRLARRAAQTS